MPRKSRQPRTLEARVTAIEKRCRGCPHSKRVIGFDVDARSVGLKRECEEAGDDATEPEEMP
jgi:hypothetical protein